MLETKGLIKKFGGLTAVDNVSFKIEEGKILGLIGPNGSGKTTVFNMITGFLEPTQGSIEFQKEVISGDPPDEIVYKGISRTFQITSMLPEMSVEENVRYGFFSRVNTGFFRCLFRGESYWKEEKNAITRAEEVLNLVGLEDRKQDLAKNITPVEQRKLMIGIALARKPRLLLLDEPAAGTSKEEQQELMAMVRKVRDAGISILIIEHHMHLIMNLCDQVVALNFGKKIADGTPEHVQNHPEVIEAYLGRNHDVT